MTSGVQAYVIRPTMSVFDGTGALSADAARALDAIARMVVTSLRHGGDASHHAITWEGVHPTGTPPSVDRISDTETLSTLVRRLLDPNGSTGGDIRSAVNCRAVTFGEDGQAMLCLRHDDPAPKTFDPSLATVSQVPAWLADTDLFDGSWPES